ncbi:hypothetical protein [Candidatus Oscillochloris fontis]|uniref:hypothetical protein n=1 Tax=Candidatus Oscillochloris fontis TaxID=2496868 RepID=UPI00101B7DE8|nr:hypothetical protein [Candidatus Oscillochloris fontis]
MMRWPMRYGRGSGYPIPDNTRKVTEIAEILLLQDGQYQLNPIYRFQQTGQDERGKIQGEFVSRPLSPRMAQRMASQGFQIPPEIIPDSA